MTRPTARALGCLAVAAFVGGCTGGGVIGAALTSGEGAPYYLPLPHSVAPDADAAPFRFAMVHDVIHERYPRHGPAFYAERERLARERLAVLHPDNDTALSLTDDIAVGLARRGRFDEAIALMRDKLKRQEALNLPGKELYSSYANLGEFLIQANLQPMLAGGAAGRARFEEGRDYIRKSKSVNLSAHFGREDWQLVAVDGLLDAAAQPELLRKIDLIGNRLDREIGIDWKHLQTGPYRSEQAVFGRPYHRDFVNEVHLTRGGRSEYELWLHDPGRHAAIRSYVYEVGGEAPPDGSSDTNYGRRAPFDEPSLWLVGEWRQGSGPSPHYALCLGEIMLRVGQRYIAWACYERAARLATDFSPQPDAQQFLRDHCKRRQRAIDDSLPAGEAGQLRSKFDSEMAFGLAFQRDYQTYEEQRIRAGANLNDEHFYDEFHAGRPPIASKVGPEEWYAGARMQPEFKILAFLVWGLFTGGACFLAVALIARLVSIRRRRVAAITPPQSPAA